MKSIFALLVAGALATAAGCRNVGYNDRSLNNSMTPEVSQKEYVRTYDQNGNPVVTPVTPAAKTDPASPDYQSPAPAK
jgi:hypothetical protein